MVEGEGLGHDALQHGIPREENLILCVCGGSGGGGGVGVDALQHGIPGDCALWYCAGCY